MKSLSIQEITNRQRADSRLTILGFAETKNKARRVHAICTCGRKIITRVQLIVNGKTMSCGCLFRETQPILATKYFPRNAAIHRSYKHMIQRCYNGNCKSYPWYGGSGVIVCAEWLHDYQAFLDWSLNNGWKPGLQIDKDINGNGKLYSPETCKWVTPKENNQKRRKKYSVT